VLTREIVTFRDCGQSRYRRSDETHRLRLHRPADVLAQLRRPRVHGANAATRLRHNRAAARSQAYIAKCKK
jgi:hypothetical protein